MHGTVPFKQATTKSEVPLNTKQPFYEDVACNFPLQAAHLGLSDGQG